LHRRLFAIAKLDGGSLSFQNFEFKEIESLVVDADRLFADISKFQKLVVSFFSPSSLSMRCMRDLTSQSHKSHIHSSTRECVVSDDHGKHSTWARQVKKRAEKRV
jgi:hypothetical protein